MKIASIFITSILLYFYPAHNPKLFLTTFKIGKFSYLIYKEKSFSHDDNWNAEFFVVYKPGRAKELCSAYISAVRNDSTFVKGNYLLYNNRIEFTESFYYKNDPVWIDSIKNIFYSNKYGNLILKKSIEFKNGVKKETKYK